MRKASIERRTNETQIELELNLDGSGRFDIQVPREAGAPFWKHMMEQWARHGRFDLTIRAAGDVEIDGHHLIEDLGIALGMALLEAVGDKKGIARYGSFALPMDEVLVLCAVDFCGRPFLQVDWQLHQERLGDFDVFLAREFLVGLSNAAKINLHLRDLTLPSTCGNAHHVLEASMKAMGRAMRTALTVEGDELPTTKGLL